MSALPDTRAVSISTAGYEDGLGRRSVRFDREVGGMLECLHLRPELWAFETSLRERADAIALLDDERFVRVREIERGPQGPVVISELIAGQRLSDVIETRQRDDSSAFGIDGAVGFLLQTLPALSTLHSLSFAHGAVAPGRILVTAASQIVLLDAIYGAALERLNLSRSAMWTNLGLLAPPFAGAPRFDSKSDVTQAAFCALLLAVGRPLESAGDPAALGPLVIEVRELSEIRAGRVFATRVQEFFAAALPLNRRLPSLTADDAAFEIQEVAEMIGEESCHTAFANLARFEAVVAKAAASVQGRVEENERPGKVAEGAPAARPAVSQPEPAPAPATPEVPIPAPVVRAPSAVEAPPTGATPPIVAKPTPPAVRPASPAIDPPPPPAPVAIPTPTVPATPPVLPAVTPAIDSPPPPTPVAIPTQTVPVTPPVPLVPAPAAVVVAPPVPIVAAPPLLSGPSAPPIAPIQPIPVAPTPAVPLSAGLPAPVVPAAAVPPGPVPVPTKPLPVPVPPSTPSIAIAPPAPLRVRTEPPAGYTPARTEIEPAVRALPFVDRTSAEERRTFPWKLAAAAVIVLTVGIFAGRTYLHGGAEPEVTAEPPRSAAPAAATVPTAGKTGSLSIDTQPSGARVSLDGADVGVTPLRLEEVTAGRHTIVVTTDNATVRRSVRVEAGRQVAVDIPVYSGWVVVFSPIPLDIASEAGTLGNTDTGRIILPPGRHVLTLTNREFGYSETRAVEINPGEERPLNVEPKGVVNVNAHPWAEVWIDGQKAGDTPIANLPVLLGTRIFLFKHPQYGERRVTATITSKPTALTIDLTKP